MPNDNQHHGSVDETCNQDEAQSPLTRGEVAGRISELDLEIPRERFATLPFTSLGGNSNLVDGLQQERR